MHKTNAGFASIMEFHVSRQARDKYQFDQALFGYNGNVIFANFHASRLFAQKMNQKRDLVNFPEQAVRAGHINAMGLIDEILHMTIDQYRQQKNPKTLELAISWLYQQLGQARVDIMLEKFATHFPPLVVYTQQASLAEYMEGQTGDLPNRQIVLEEMIMLWLANLNPAFTPFLELFDDEGLEKESVYLRAMSSLHDFFETQPRFGPDNQNIIDMLRAPALAHPHSLTAQLEFIRQKWSTLLGKFLYRLLSSLDLVKEEEKTLFGGGFMGPGPSRVYEFRGMEAEPERFSPDKDWMPSLVLIAKNAFVWLDQLSKQYKRNLTTLDQIPDEELDKLARWGVTGLWLIGLWERSSASKRVKQLRGNIDAVASAYSLFDYQIAGDLGGEPAYQNLRDRAWKRGLRLASDMVPNHMGIDSRWVVEHPNWFVGLDYSPYPSYSFNGTDLSWDERVGIYLEDHYYNNSDAAVVFKRVDKWTGSQRFIYHGNDGTSMPWNDTAQLNYLDPQVREAVIQTILNVARRFPIIRFDAAMTLAKKHYQRLWFPEPGTGGAIPSRSEFGLTKEQFDAAFPEEFWREVVDRVAQEVPDTLLLAEAFWLMEGYFVRTLGMHRVYNSAFMNMLRDEKNAEYRLVIKNTLEFDPEILKRYVNFMNNPDERTAVDQFGKGDKYFGVCTLMATLPGLPMVGHGQVEGFTEKYGMEYRRAYWEETPDQYLIERHDREVFPLLRKRYLFAEVRDFLLYDFYTTEGGVNEDVFAYSNRSGSERTLVVYHNRFASSQGWIRTSAAYSIKTASGDRALTQKNLGDGLGLANDEDIFSIFRDQITGLEYIRSSRELCDKGLYVELNAYKCHVFLDWREIADNESHQYSQLARYLNGRGVPSIDEALKEIFLQPIHTAYRELVNAGMLRWLIENRLQVSQAELGEVASPQLPATYALAVDEAERKAVRLLEEMKAITSGSGDPQEIAAKIRKELEAALRLPSLSERSGVSGAGLPSKAIDYLLSRKQATGSPHENGDSWVWGPLLEWVFTHGLGTMIDPQNSCQVTRSWIDEWLLGRILAGSLGDLGMDEITAWRSVELIKLLTMHCGWYDPAYSENNQAYLVLQGWLNDTELQRFIGVNRFQDLLWYNKEAFENLVWWMYAIAVIELLSSQPEGKEIQAIEDCYQIVVTLLKAEEESGFQIEKLLAATKKV